jgi:SAM-dependent methyltransferase
MALADQILFRIAKNLYKTEIGQTQKQRESLKSIDNYDAYRSEEIRRILGAAEQYGVEIIGKIILDFGCGDGAISPHYLRHGATRVIGSDISEQAIRRARQLREDERLRFVQNSANSIPLENASVDIAISYDAFEHIADLGPMLRELHRILTPDGKLLIGTWGWKHPWAPHLWGVMPVPWAHVLFSERTVMRVCRRVYQSPWYRPDMHDYNKNGHRIDKYEHDDIPLDWVNKLLIIDFEREFAQAGFHYETHAIPFSFAGWSRPLLKVRWLREYLSGYVWFVLMKENGS